MQIIKTGMAGTMESSDINILIEPNEAKGITIHLNSPVEKQFGQQIRQVIQDALATLKVTDAVVRANDKGALDCTIRARVIAAAYRAAGTDANYNWEELDKWID